VSPAWTWDVYRLCSAGWAATATIVGRDVAHAQFAVQIGCFSSLLSYSGHSGRVVDAYFVSPDTSNTLQMASADSTGCLHLWDAEVQPRRAQKQRPTLSLAAAPPTEAALDGGRVLKLLPHGPLLLAATQAAGVRAFDARAGVRPVWALAVPGTHGVATCMAAVPDAPALVTATSRGMLHLWDLRFQARLEPRTFAALPRHQNWLCTAVSCACIF
jgi:hypothetical protein